MTLKVANEDVKSFKNNNTWLVNHPMKAILFSNVEETWAQIQRTYNSFFSNLVFGQLPTNTMILETLQKIAKRLQRIEWAVVI